MNKLLVLIILMGISISVRAQTPFKGADYIYYYQVGIGKTNGSLTNQAAWLEIGKDSTTKAIRMPRVVDTANISSPVYGLQVYQIKDNGMYFRDKVSWKRMIDPGILNFYLLKADSTIFYPYWSNPRGYISTELDPVANAKTVRWIAGTGINVSNGAAQPLSSNPVATISAQNTTALWNANQIQGVPVAGTAPTNGQFLQYNGSQYIPVNAPAAGTVTSVGLSMPSIFNVTGSPVTGAGALTAAFNSQTANLMFASPNGISGLPLFRSMTNSDLPNSGVTGGTYGGSNAIPVVTVNSKGVITGISTRIPATVWDSVMNKPNDGNFVYAQSAVSQPAAFWVSGSGRVDGGIMRVGNASNPANYGSLESSTVDVVVRAKNSSNGLMRPISFDGQKYTFFANDGGYYWLVMENDQVAIDSMARVTIGYTAATNPAIVPGVKLQIKGDIIATAQPYTTGGITALGINTTTKRFETFIPSGGGSVTSVGLSVPSEFSVSGSPVTSSGTLTVTKAAQSPNTVYAGPASGASAAPTFRALARQDIPRNNVTTINDAAYTVSSTDDFVIFGSTITANHTVTLPSAAANTGRIIYLVTLEMDGTFNYSPSPSILLNSGTIITGLGNNSATTIYSDGTNWRLLNESTN